MAHQWALSVSQDNVAKEAWIKRMSESKFEHFEYSCGAFPNRRSAEENERRARHLAEQEKKREEERRRAEAVNMPEGDGLPKDDRPEMKD